MGYKEEDEDVEKSLTTGKKERKRSTSSKQPQKKHTALSGFLGMLSAVVLLAIVAIIAVAVYENDKIDDTSEGTRNCSTLSYPGINASDLTPNMISQQKTCYIEGNCWTGEQCYECFRLDVWEVGSINDIPVCCPMCGLSRLSVSNNSCDCLDNAR